MNCNSKSFSHQLLKLETAQLAASKLFLVPKELPMAQEIPGSEVVLKWNKN